MLIHVVVNSSAESPQLQWNTLDLSGPDFRGIFLFCRTQCAWSADLVPAAPAGAWPYEEVSGSPVESSAPVQTGSSHCTYHCSAVRHRPLQAHTQQNIVMVFCVYSIRVWGMEGGGGEGEGGAEEGWRQKKVQRSPEQQLQGNRIRLSSSICRFITANWFREMLERTGRRTWAGVRKHSREREFSSHAHVTCGPLRTRMETFRDSEAKRRQDVFFVHFFLHLHQIKAEETGCKSSCLFPRNWTLCFTPADWAQLTSIINIK